VIIEPFPGIYADVIIIGPLAVSDAYLHALLNIHVTFNPSFSVTTSFGIISSGILQN